MKLVHKRQDYLHTLYLSKVLLKVLTAHNSLVQVILKVHLHNFLHCHLVVLPQLLLQVHPRCLRLHIHLTVLQGQQQLNKHHPNSQIFLLVLVLTIYQVRVKGCHQVMLQQVHRVYSN